MVEERDDAPRWALRPEFPRASNVSRYPPRWQTQNQMGPNALWLTEFATADLGGVLKPGCRVLDLGCGKAMSSVFLALEFGVEVWAVDWWMSAEANERRVAEMSAATLVHPVKAEAHQLPFEDGFFDAVVSVDSYQYWGTDELYLHYLSRFLKQGAPLSIVMPALTRDIGDEVPAHLLQPMTHGTPFWEAECWSFKTAEFWRRLWSRCPYVEAVEAVVQEGGWKHWRDFEAAVEASGDALFPSSAEALEADGGRTLGFVRARARRNGRAHGENLYDPALGVKAGAEK